MISPISTTIATDLAPAQKPTALQRNPALIEKSPTEQAKELKEAFGQFVGETFFAQMLKSMRATVGEPAYFHGGHAEEQFQARLDQQIAEELASGGGGFSDQLFESSFPKEAALLERTANESANESPLSQLDSLRRR